MDEGAWHPLDPDVRPPGVQSRREVPLLGRPRPRGGGRRTGADRGGVRVVREGRHPGALRDHGDAGDYGPLPTRPRLAPPTPPPPPTTPPNLPLLSPLTTH